MGFRSNFRVALKKKRMQRLNIFICCLLFFIEKNKKKSVLSMLQKKIDPDIGFYSSLWSDTITLLSFENCFSQNKCILFIYFFKMNKDSIRLMLFLKKIRKSRTFAVFCNNTKKQSF